MADRFACGKLVLLLAVMVAWMPAAGDAVTLEDCIQTALKDNPDTQAASARIEAAREALQQSAASYYPWISLSAEYSRTDNPPQAFMMELNQRTLDMAAPSFNPNEPDDTRNIRLSAAAQWRLYDGGRREADRGMADVAVKLSESALRGLRNALIHEVTRGYYGVLQAGALMRVQEEQVASLEENLRVARERFDNGSVVKTDVLNLEVRLAEAHEDLIRARNGRRLAVAALNTAIGRELVVAEAELQGTDRMPEEMVVDPDAEDAVAARPELQAARLMVRMGERKVSRARREYVPAFNAFGSMDSDGKDLGDSESSYVMGVRAEWNLFEGFRRKHMVGEARSALNAAKAQAVSVGNRLRLDLRTAVLEAEEARERLAVTRKSVESAGEALRITRERYQQGAADIVELLTAQVGLTAIRTRDVSAFYDCLVACSNVARARGQLVEMYGQQE